MSNTEQFATPLSTELTFAWLSINSLVNFTNQEVTVNQVRWWLRSRDTNELSKYTRKIGRKIYIHKYGFMKWFEEEVA